MRAIRRHLTVALSTAVVAAGLGMLPAPTAFATPVCTGSVAAGLTYTCLPSGSGSVTVTVPGGVSSINVTADGGGGGKNASLGNGGSGARLNATFSVSPGNVLTIYPGAGGGPGLGGSGNVGGSGYGAGGNGGPYYGEGFGGGYGGGGGGSSALLIGGTPVLVAGGGGGGGNFYGGSAASAIGGSGGQADGSCAVGGGGGNAAGSGSAGTRGGTGATTVATAGYAGHGGDGTYGAGGSSSGGGGGGGGYGGGGPGNWRGPYGCTLAGGGGAGGSFGPAGTVYGSASNAGGVATSGAGGDGQVVIQFIATPATVPGAPTDLVFSGVTTSEMTLYWTPPATDGGSPLLGYDVSVNSGSPVRVTGTSQSLTGLASGTTYSVSIRAVNSVGSSATALTGSQQTVTPGTATGPATNLVFSGVSSSAITASWTTPTPVTNWPTLGYQVRVDGGTLTWSPTTTYTASGLAPAASHSFAIYVVNGAGTSAPLNGNQSTYATVPDAPTDLVFSAVTDTSITADWTAPTSTGGASIVKYWVSVDGGASVDVGNVTSYTKSGLAPSTWHTFAIAANNGIGNSPDLTGSRSTNAPAGSPMITATSPQVGSASTITLSGYPANTTQTVQVTAPDASMSNVSVTVNGSGAGTGSYTPSAAGTYSVVTSPDARSTTFTATSPPAPGPGPAPDSGSSSGSGTSTTPTTPTTTPASDVSSETTRTPTKVTIRITGHAGRGRHAGRAFVSGRTTAAAGTLVSIRVRVAGTRAYVTAGKARVTTAGTFAWQQREAKPIYAYARLARGVFSNRVVIRPAR